MTPRLRRYTSSILRAATGMFSDTPSPLASSFLSGLWPSSVGEPPTRGARERVAAYADVPWVFAVADKVSDAFAAVPWTLSAVRRRGEARAVRVKGLQRAGYAERRAGLKALRAADELVDIPTHPLLDVLEGGNALMTGLAVRKTTALHWDLEGEAFWLKERNQAGVPVAIWPLPPDWVRSTPTPTTPAYRVGFRGWQGTIPETEILWLPNHNPSNPYGRGTGFIRALADEVETDEYAARTVRQSFMNMNRPDFIVYPKTGTLTPSQREQLQEDWTQQHEGFWRAFRGRFATQELGVYEFGAADMRKAQMVQLREFQQDTIRKIWGLPPETMGIVEPGASRATINRAFYMMAKLVLVPRLERFRALLQERLVPEYDDRLVVSYVTPVEEDRDFALEVRKAAPWAWRVDEWRELGGSEPLDDGVGRPFLVPSTLYPQEEYTGAPFPAAPPVPPGPANASGLPADELEVLDRVTRFLAGAS